MRRPRILISARAASDLRDLRDRVLRHLSGEADQTVPAGAIVAAEDMPPSMFLATDWRGGGLVLRRGSPSSHVAILARSRGVPMIVGVDIDSVEDGRDAVLDADAGLLLIGPDAATHASYRQRRDEQAELRQAYASFTGPALTASGEKVQVMINVTGLAELGEIDPDIVDGIGLMRTEFLFQGREKLPTEEEQYQIYRRMVEWAAGKPVTIRTLDAGGDKPIAGLTQPGDLNPFLGVRGVRLSLRHREVFRAQLRALLRAAAAGNLKVMIPMVTVPEEFNICRTLMGEAYAELRNEGQEARLPPLGMMVEVPAAALAVDDFGADFFSIGSNDLIQYVMAASRDEPLLADLAQPSRAGVRADRPCRGLRGPYRPRGKPVRRSGGRSEACRVVAGSGFAHLLGRSGIARTGQGRDLALFWFGMSISTSPAGSQGAVPGTDRRL